MKTRIIKIKTRNLLYEYINTLKLLNKKPLSRPRYILKLRYCLKRFHFILLK